MLYIYAYLNLYLRFLRVLERLTFERRVFERLPPFDRAASPAACPSTYDEAAAFNFAFPYEEGVLGRDMPPIGVAFPALNPSCQALFFIAIPSFELGIL